MNDFKQIFFEAEHDERETQKALQQAKIEREQAQAELLKARKELAEAQAKERLERAKEIERRAEQQNDKQRRNSNAVYITTLFVSLLTLLPYLIIFIILITKY